MSANLTVEEMTTLAKLNKLAHTTAPWGHDSTDTRYCGNCNNPLNIEVNGQDCSLCDNCLDVLESLEGQYHGEGPITNIHNKRLINSVYRGKGASKPGRHRRTDKYNMDEKCD